MQNALKSETKFWWLYLIIGILLSLLGISFFVNVGIAISFVTAFMGIFFLVSGLAGAIKCIVDREFIHLWGLHLALNIIVFLAGIAMLTRPSFALSFLWVICGMGFFFSGISTIFMAIQAKKLELSGWVLMLILGILVLISSFTIMAQPLTAVFVVGLCAGFSALFSGINDIVLAFQLKKAGF